ncbi:unnamed protein product [Rotaria sordida]|uniref:BZIP domain-containing protein n=1 Tax=Rotaria sordida TaxID=392033 RepID=A0A818VAA9_9BILA|nr:unnamed protein product [Rotaria sordida]CAF1104880.1 unnamed protein product [Rotaria sordida]CAF1121494.1 unnamed protein product [Rotaria sordida]CAF1168886.1 unnamed protein product [Rotaria sordida]CAF1322258.1 unnamed protein product [Rotaria sordida]
MGKRGRKPMKIDSNTQLEKSRESARQCRRRKKLRYEYLEELVIDREKAITKLHEELRRLRSVCQQIDQHEITNEIRQELIQWIDDAEINNQTQ